MTEQIKGCCEWIKKKVFQQKSRRDETRYSQNGYRKTRDGTGPQVLCKHQDNEEPRVDTCIKNGGDQQVERKKSC